MKLKQLMCDRVDCRHKLESNQGRCWTPLYWICPYYNIDKRSPPQEHLTENQLKRAREGGL